jgi:hypothetical protein
VVAEVDATFEDVVVDHEGGGEMGSAMSARDDGEVGMVVVDMVRVLEQLSEFQNYILHIARCRVAVVL